MTDPCSSSRWSDLPGDLLGRILQLLELPEALAVAAVCTSWSSAATAAGVPPSCTPWLMSWSHYPVEQQQRNLHLRERRLHCIEFCNLLDNCKTYAVSLPQGRSMTWCGASHGWLVAVDELSNLLLYSPFTFAKIPLPPITDFDCIEAVYDSEGIIVEYLFGRYKSRHGVNCIGTWFYQKAVLSSAPSQGRDFTAMLIHFDAPSQGRDFTAMLIHFDANQVSFARAGEGCWQLASTIPQDSKDRYADCVYHRGRFYTLTMHGVFEMWDLDGSSEPKKMVFFPKGDGKYKQVFLRFLVSTPWGDLLQIRFLRSLHRPKRIQAQILEVDVVKNRSVKLRSGAVFQEHAVFVGQNHSACLPAKNFPGVRPNCVYLTRSWLAHRENFGFTSGGRGIGIYNLQSRMLEEVFPCYEHDYPNYLLPSEVWVTPNVR